MTTGAIAVVSVTSSFLTPRPPLILPKRSPLSLSTSIHPHFAEALTFFSKMTAFDSDDLVSSDRPGASRSQSRPDAKSIDLIFGHAAADRMSTKKLVKQLESTDGGVVPGTRMRQSLWINRLDGLRTAWVQDLTYPFTGGNVIRVFAAIMHAYVAHPLSRASADLKTAKLSLHRDKTVRQNSSVVRGLTVLLAYGYSKYPDFKMSPHDADRFKVSSSSAQ